LKISPEGITLFGGIYMADIAMLQRIRKHIAGSGLMRRILNYPGMKYDVNKQVKC